MPVQTDRDVVALNCCRWNWDASRLFLVLILPLHYQTIPCGVEGNGMIGFTIPGNSSDDFLHRFECVLRDHDPGVCFPIRDDLFPVGIISLDLFGQKGPWAG